MNTFGFGGVQSGISARSRETAQGFGIASTLELDKFMPEKWGWSIPLFMNYDQQTIKPHFNPLDPDIVLERSLQQFETEAEKQAYRDLVIDQTINKGFNLANVRKIQTDPSAKANLYDIENFSFSYAQNSLRRSNVLLQEYASEQKKGALAYEFSPRQTLWEPFKSNENMEKPMWRWVKDINFSPIPNLFAFRTDFDRSFIKTQYRNANLGTIGIDPNYIKFFNTNRFYDVQWDFTKSINFNYSAQMRSLIDEPYGERDKEAVWDNLKSFGRANFFKQSIQATYAIPLDKFLLLDWIKSDARFNADYIFRANSWDFNQGTTITDVDNLQFGNFIENNREYAFQGQVDLVRLYNKLKYLRFANTPDAPVERFTRAPGVEEDVTLPTSDLLKKFTRLLMTVRGINFNFVRTEGTILPGFLETPNLLGLAKGSRAPGLGFAMFGSQNAELSQFAQKGWLSESKVRNDPFTQNRQTKFDFSTNLEPWTGFRMRIFGNYARGDSYQQIYKPDRDGNFGATNPFRNGTFSMSFWSFKTVFTKMDDNPETNYRYEVFENMKANRELVINKLNQINGSGENAGYHPNSQDVLIPAFFAAYTGNTVDNIFDKVVKKGKNTFNPFLQFPMPNWRIDYGGLEKLPLFKKAFSSLTLNHSYSSTYSVGNFTSSLLYGAGLVNLAVRDYRLGDETSIFESNGSSFNYFLPVFIMSAITMEERYTPLIGVQFTLKNKVSGSIRYNKERRASLNLSNTQVAEQTSDDLNFGFGFKRAGIKLPFRGRDGNLVVLKNDVNFRFDLTLRDQKLLQRRLDYQYANSAEDGTYGEVIPIQGNYNFQLRPQVQYQFNKKLSMSFYIEHFKNLPFTSITFARSQTVGGINMRFNLAD
jgi:cell surface protein SprA